jgi:hypothetical protein
MTWTNAKLPTEQKLPQMHTLELQDWWGMLWGVDSELTRLWADESASEDIVSATEHLRDLLSCRG